MPSYDLTSGKTGRTYKVEFDNDPTPEDVDFAIDYFDNQPVAEEQPSYLSQLGTALSTGTQTALASGRTAFNVLTGDTEDTATALADLAAAQREAQAAQTPEDVAFMQDLQQQAAELKAAEGILPTLREAVDLPLAALRQPGAALKTAVQSLPNVLVSTPVTIGAGLAGAAIGGAAGLPTTGPGALVTGALGAAAGGALANTALEVGPAVFDILNERTNGAAANWTREQILEALKADPTIVEEGLKRGATRGAVIGAAEAIGLGAGSRLAGASGRAVQQATRRALVEQGVDLADDVAVRAGMQLPAVQAAREAAQAGFTRAGEVARVAGGAGIETAASGAGEALAQLATGEDVDTADVFLEMLGESVASVPTVLAGQVLGRDPVVRATAANVQRAEEVMGEAFPNVDELEAQVGREAADAVAQAVVDAGVPVGQPTVEGELPIEVTPPVAQAPATPSVALSPSPNLAPRATENAPPRPVRQPNESRQDFVARRDEWDATYGRTHNEDGTPYQPTVLDETVAKATSALQNKGLDERIDAVGTDINAELGTGLTQLLDDGWVWDDVQQRMVDPQNRGETPIQALRRIRGQTPASPAAQPSTAPAAAPQAPSASAQRTMRVPIPGGGFIEVPVGAAPQPVSEPTPIAPVESLPAVEAEAPAAVETQTQPEPQTPNAPEIRQIPEDGQLQRQNADEGGPTAEAGGGNRPVEGGQVQQEVTPEPVQPAEAAPAVSELPAPQARVVSPEGVTPTQPLPPTGGVPTESLPAGQPTSGDVGTALRAVATNTATPEQVASLEAQGLARTVQGQPVITDAGLAQMPEAERPRLTEAERVAEIEGQGGIMASLRDMDAPYLDAVARGDMETAQRLVDEAAYSSGFRKEGYHGTHRDFTVFDRLNAAKDRIGLKLDIVGNWFTDSPATARKLYGPRVVRAFLGLKNPLRFDGVGGLDSFRSEVKEAHGSVEAFRKWAKERGYDGVEISGDFVDGELQTFQIVFEPNQIKSADPVTYDDSGNVIPLSQRFQPESPDIRFSVRNTPPANVQPSIRPLQGDQHRNETLARRKRPRPSSPTVLRARDGQPLPNIRVTADNAAKARDKESRQVPGASETWIGSTEQFLAEFADTDAGRAVEGNTAIEAFYDSATDRAVVLTDRVQVLEGDARRAVRNGTSAAEEAVRRLIRHESFVHRGWRALPSDLRTQFLALADSVPSAEDLDAIAKTYRRYANWRDDASLKALVFEEWLAQRIERIEKLPAAADGPLAQVKEWLGRVWQWLTGDDSLEATPTELRDMIRQMVRALETGEKEVAPDAVMASLRDTPRVEEVSFSELLDPVPIERDPNQVEQTKARLAELAQKFNFGDIYDVANILERWVETGIAERFGATPGDAQEAQQLMDFLRNDMVYPPETDGYYYHVTTKRNAKAILKSGAIRPNQPRQFSTAATESNTRGRVFFSELSGVGFWRDRIQEQLDDRESREKLTVLRIPKSFVTDPQIDNALEKRTDSFFVETEIPINGGLMFSLTQDPNADTLRRIVSEASEGPEATSQAQPFAPGVTPDMPLQQFADGRMAEANLNYGVAEQKLQREKAIEFLDAMGPIGEWGQKLLSPEWRASNGLDLSSALGQYVLTEALLRTQGRMSDVTTEGVAAKRSNAIIAGLFSGAGTNQAQGLNARMNIQRDPRYAALFVVQAATDMTNKTAATVVDPQTNVPAATDAVRQGDEQARQQATDDLAEELRLRDLIYDMGIAAQDAGIAERIRRINDNVFRLGVIERMRAAMAAAGVAPSFVSASRAAVEQQYEGFTLEQLEAEAARLRDEIRQDVAAVEQAAKATPRKGRKGSDPASQAKALIEKLEASPQVPKKPKPNPVRDLYQKHLKEPMAAEDFIGALTAIGVDIADAQKLYDLAAIKIAALETAKANRPSQKEKLSEAERFAERVINDAAEQFADPALPVEEKQRKTLPIRDLFNFHVQNGMTLETFIPAAAQAGLDEATARRLHGAGLLVREARQSAKTARTEQKLDEMAAKEAGRLIYETSKLHRQSGYINATSPEADTIRKAFMDQVKKPMPFEQFAERLKALRVEEDLATRLFNVADREHAARKAVALERERQAEFKRLSDRADRLLDPEKNALASALNNIRSKTEGAPTWAQLFNQPFETQRQWRQRFYEALRADPALANLTPQETRDLAAALDKVWNDKRERNLQSILKRANLPGTKEKTKQKIAESVPLLLRYLNTGVFNDDSFRAAVAKKFGAKVLTADDLAKISDLAQRAQKDGISTPERTKLLDEMIRTIQLGAGVELGEVISNVWVTSVLSGFRTQFDMALSSLNGLRGMAQTAADVAIRKRNFKMVGEAAKAYFKTMANTILESANYFVTGDPTLLDGYQYTATQFMNEGLVAANPFDFFEQVIKDPRVGPWGKITAYFFAGIQRAMRIWDHVNSTSVKEGMIPLAMALDPERYKDARMPSKEDVAMAKEKAIAIVGGNKTWPQKRDVTSYTRQILNDLLNSRYPGLLDEARETGFTLAYQNDPTGLGGIVYHTLLGVTKKMVNAAGKFRDEGVAKREQSEWNEAAKVTDKAMRGLLYIGATNARNMFGFRFVRFVGNRVNELISFTPLVGLARLAEKDMSATKRSMIYTNQVVGSMFGLWVISSMIRAMEDEEDPEKRGFDVEGSWANLTPTQKNQRRGEGKIPYSIKIGDTNFNYNAWPMASLIATVGNLYDMKRYRPDKWNEKDVFDRLISAAWSGATSFTDISSLSGLMDLLGRSAYSTDPVEGAKQWAAKFSANYVGGFIPRALKDLDMVFDPEARKPDNLFGYFAKEIPFYRRTEAAGEKLYDIFGEPVQMRREPWSRSFSQDKLEPEYNLLGDLNERGIFLSPANPDNRTVGSGANRRELTKAEAEAYMMETGKLYKDYVLQQGERLKELDFETAKEKVSRDTERLRNAALRRAISITAQ